MIYWEKTITQNTEYGSGCLCDKCDSIRKKEQFNDINIRILSCGLLVNLNSNYFDSNFLK